MNFRNVRQGDTLSIIRHPRSSLNGHRGTVLEVIPKHAPTHAILLVQDYPRPGTTTTTHLTAEQVIATPKEQP